MAFTYNVITTAGRVTNTNLLIVNLIFNISALNPIVSTFSSICPPHMPKGEICPLKVYGLFESIIITVTIAFITITASMMAGASLRTLKKFIPLGES